MKNEIWKPIVDFATYEISNFGNVRSLSKEYSRIHPNCNDPTRLQKIKTKPKQLHWYIRYLRNKPSCVTVNLRKNGKTYVVRVHRLVLMAFKGIPDKSSQEGCHNDGNPLNNNIENLRWDTHENNCLDMIKHGTRTNPPTHYGESHHKTTLTKDQVIEIRSTKYYRGLFSDLAKKYNVRLITISRIYNKTSWINLKD